MLGDVGLPATMGIMAAIALAITLFAVALTFAVDVVCKVAEER